jgi:hypothetical protein
MTCHVLPARYDTKPDITHIGVKTSAGIEANYLDLRAEGNIYWSEYSQAVPPRPSGKGKLEARKRREGDTFMGGS